MAIAWRERPPGLAAREATHTTERLEDVAADTSARLASPMSLLRPSASPGGAGVGGAQQRGGSSPPARQDPLRSGALFRMASPAPRLLKPAVARGGVASPGGVAQVAAQQVRATARAWGRRWRPQAFCGPR